MYSSYVAGLCSDLCTSCVSASSACSLDGLALQTGLLHAIRVPRPVSRTMRAVLACADVLMRSCAARTHL